MRPLPLRLLFRSLPLPFLLLLLIFPGCKKECKDVECLNGGICNEGECFCPDGFSGQNCEIDLNAPDMSHIHPNGLGMGNAYSDPSDIPHYVPAQIGNPGGGPGSVDLSWSLPPVENQGDLGTCTAWASAYYALTGMYCLDHRIHASDLSNDQAQFSPTDLYLSIPSVGRGLNCGTTTLKRGFNQMLSRGVSTFYWAPYSNMGNCSQSPEPQWTQVANFHKIHSYRKVGFEVDSVKRALQNDHLVIFGANVDSTFGHYQGGIINSAEGKKYGHAMVICGYSDSLQAFHIVNSWGESWGENGYGWIDYNFFFSDFAMHRNVFVLNNDDVYHYPPDSMNGQGCNLTPWVFFDHSTYAVSGNPREREVRYDLYNHGNQTAFAADDYKIVYQYTSATDLRDGGILFIDEVNTNIAPNTYSCNGNDCDFNFDLPPDSGLAEMALQQPYIQKTYEMPNITGDYYIVMYVDPYINVTNEANRSNDVFYVTDHGAWHFENGQAEKRLTELPSFENHLNEMQVRGETSEFNSARSEENPNGYSRDEFKWGMRQLQDAGIWQDWVLDYRSRTK